MRVTQYADPFRHWVGESVVPPRLVAACLSNLPSVRSPDWIRYDTEAERRKWTMEKRSAMPDPWAGLFTRLDGLAGELSERLNTTLRPDARGAGIHVTFPGGWLSPHLDYALHPSGLERRVNLILFLNDCDREYGGGLQLCDPLGVPVKTLYPKAGEAVVWECGDETYHAVEPLANDAQPRVTAACYYLAPPRANCTRRRALFMPRR